MSGTIAATTDSSPAIDLARQALAKANAAVAADRRAHSPSCVASDQKIADQALAGLTQAQSKARADSLAKSSAASGGATGSILTVSW